jgi:predicted HD phosphohydrolase
MVSGKARLIANEVIELYQNHGGSGDEGTNTSQLDRLVRIAQIAEDKGLEEELILAAFLQDIGQVSLAANVEGQKQVSAEDFAEAGADYLREKGFSKRLVRLVESGTEAKRYLAFKDPSYYEQLSESARTTLEQQGGKMYAEEAEAFEKYPLFDDIITIRKLDQELQTETFQAPDLEHVRNMLIRHLVKGSY